MQQNAIRTSQLNHWHIQHTIPTVTAKFFKYYPSQDNLTFGLLSNFGSVHHHQIFAYGPIITSSLLWILPNNDSNSVTSVYSEVEWFVLILPSLWHHHLLKKNVCSQLSI